MKKTGSRVGEINKYDISSAAIYTAIASGAVILTALITAFMPFLKLDASIIDTKYITITPGNLVTVFLTFLGVIAKKFGQDRSNIIYDETK
jgi:hypothetical protein